MSDRLKVSTSNLEEIMQVLNRLHDDLNQTKSMLSRVDTSVSSINELRLRLNGMMLSFPEALRITSRQIAQTGDYVEQTRNAVQRSIELFEETEAEIRNAFDLTGRPLESGQGSAESGRGMAHDTDISQQDTRPGFTRLRDVASIGVLATASNNDDEADKRAKFDAALEERSKNACHADTLLLYQKYQSQIKVADDENKHNGRYNPYFNEFVYNWKEDCNSAIGYGSNYYHEVGHAIDDFMTPFGYNSESGLAGISFSLALEHDFNEYVKSVMTKHQCSRKEAYAHIVDWICLDYSHKIGIQDLLEGLSLHGINYDGGHNLVYWLTSSPLVDGLIIGGASEKICREAFAHFFEAGMDTNPAKLDYITTIFPTAYAKYEEIIRADLNSK